VQFLFTRVAASAQVSKWHKGDALQHCSENVRYLRSCCRVGEPAGKPLEPDII